MKILLTLFILLLSTVSYGQKKIVILESPFQATKPIINEKGDTVVYVTMVQNPIYINSNYTLHDSCNMRTIWAAGKDTIYFPPLTPGFKAWVQAGSGTVILKPLGTTAIPSSQLSISTNSKQGFIDYKTNLIFNVRQ